MRKPRVVIIGGGFGGLYAARSLKVAPVEVTLIDRHNHHLFQPLLYQVATAGLTTGHIAAPLRKVLRRQKNATVLLAEATRIDTQGRRVILEDGMVEYDFLIVATGATHAYFGRNDWEALAPGLKTAEDALETRRRVLLAFEAAERETDPERRRALLTFVVVGAGPTGVEMAGALSELARHTLADEFRRFDPREARVILLEAGDRVLPTYPAGLSRKAREQLERLGVEVCLSSAVSHVDDSGVVAGGERIDAHTVIWAAGVRASPLVRSLNAPLDRTGRVWVEDDLSVPGAPEVFVVGDTAAIRNAGDTVPGVAPAAIQAGRHAAANILATVRGEERQPFTYRDKGALATIGRSAAVAHSGRWKFSGFWAWLAWLVVHVLFLITFRNRFAVVFEWAWAYFTYQRTARVVVEGARALPEPVEDRIERRVG